MCKFLMIFLNFFHLTALLSRVSALLQSPGQTNVLERLYQYKSDFFLENFDAFTT
uniref:Secreted protein n=1 Tax=Phakopsora pachyrhizi TaxID=170000 RepID=A0A0S1MIQ5_PHAPC